MIAIACPQLGGEEALAVSRVLASKRLAQGEQVLAFEQRFAEYCRVREAIAVSSGTAALHLALLAHDIGPGDEVITTPFSFAATANAILLTGARPVFVDIEPDTYSLDHDLVEAAITPRTRAVLPVHLYGHPCALESLLPLVDRHRLALIEDACQAHAASFQGRLCGSFGTGCFSFYATKNMTTGEGGMITTNDHTLAERLRLLRNHGQVARYHHIAVGYNQRLTEMQAAIGLVQLEKLESFTRQRISNAMFLTKYLSKVVQTPCVRPSCRHVFHQYTIRVPGDRDAWVRHLQAQGIGAAIHYPVPIHQQPYFQQARDNTRFPVAEAAAREVLSLPVHPALSREDLVTIVEEVLAYAHKGWGDWRGDDGYESPACAQGIS